MRSLLVKSCLSISSLKIQISVFFCSEMNRTTFCEDVMDVEMALTE